jgi:hypothetical protein
LCYLDKDQSGHRCDTEPPNGDTHVRAGRANADEPASNVRDADTAAA